MAYTTINKSSEHFDTKTYSASGAGSISDVSFQPDFMWFKNRTIVGDHGLMDAVRGVNGIIHSNDANAEVTSNGTTNITAFTSNGFTYGASSLIDTGAGTPCTWLWKANGAGSANTDGSISSTVSANTTSGFSIVSYTGTGANATVGHGLGANMDFAIFKLRSGANSWLVYHKSLGATKAIYLNETGAVGTNSSGFNNTEPTSSVFSLGSGAAANTSGGTNIAYCFAEKQGFSKFGSYTGNGNADGTFIYTGFKPAWLMVKNTATTSSWEIWDAKRNTFNPTAKSIFPDGAGAEYDYTNRVDLLSNGFKLKTTSSPNGSGNTHIFMAFAEEPLVGSNNTPCTAR